MRLPPALQARWDTLAHRERLLVLAAIALVLAALVWWVLVGPALRTLRTSAEQHRVLDAQLQQMRSFAAQAQALQSQPQANFDESLRALEATTRQRLPSAQLSVVGERATVTLRGVAPDALIQWLAQVRVNARALPSEVRLVRNPAPGSTSWDGTLVLSLPAR
jgi:general secretion pathway protein M